MHFLVVFNIFQFFSIFFNLILYFSRLTLHFYILISLFANSNRVMLHFFNFILCKFNIVNIYLRARENAIYLIKLLIFKLGKLLLLLKVFNILQLNEFNVFIKILFLKELNLMNKNDN